MGGDMGFVSRLQENIRTVFTGKLEMGKTNLDALWNLALLRIDRKTEHPMPKEIPPLTKEEKRAVKEFYKPYVRFLTDRYHRYYTFKSGGKFYPEYLPEELYVMHVDRYFSRREESVFLDNKCYYYRLFSHVKQPELIGLRIGQTWLNQDLEPVSCEEIEALAAKEPEVVVKDAVQSEGGAGVTFLTEGTNRGDFRRRVSNAPGDLVVQKPIRQHPSYARLHRESVNTLRIVSLLTESEVKIYAVTLRVGAGGNRVDNGHYGGIFCGIEPDGRLKERAVFYSGEPVFCHPDLGYRFCDRQVPYVDKACALVKSAHPFAGHFRLISWDVAIDEEGEAVLIEANFSLGGIKGIQICDGPLFGSDTRKVLDEVFRGKKRKWTTWR